MNAIHAVWDFFDRRLDVSTEVRQHLGMGAEVSRQHLIQHLVEQTIRRASIDAATQRALGAEETTDVSWKRCLMVAALDELRPLRMRARPQI